jgi:hypothetical protein
LIASAIFALHPIQSDAAIYVWARPILLATLLCLLSLHAWLAGRTGLAAAWFAAALLAKEECAAFPLVLAWFEPKRWRAAAAMMTLSAAAAAHVVYAAAVTPGAPIAQQAGIGPMSYFLAQGAVVPRYLRMLVVPWGFTIDPEVAVPAALVGLAGWAAVAAGAAAALRFSPREGRWLVAGVILLLPSSSFFPAADLAADRRMYLPMIGFSAAIGLWLGRVRPAVPIALCAALGALSLARTQVWRSPEALWREAVERAPGKLRPRLQLARALSPLDALPVLEAARLLAPEDPDVAAQTGATLLAAGRPADALAELGRALALDPSNPRHLNNRGAALEAVGQREAALADYRRATALDPAFAPALENVRRLTGPPHPTQ